MTLCLPGAEMAAALAQAVELVSTVNLVVIPTVPAVTVRFGKTKQAFAIAGVTVKAMVPV